VTIYIHRGEPGPCARTNPSPYRQHEQVNGTRTFSLIDMMYVNNKLYTTLSHAFYKK